MGGRTIRDLGVASLTPITLSHPGLAVATARAGGIAVLDADLCSAADLPEARRNLHSLLALAPGNSRVGLRLRTEQIPDLGVLLKDLAARDHWLVLSNWGVAAGPDLVGR